MRKKQLFVLLIALAMMLSMFAGCQQPTGDTETEAPETQESVEVSESTPAEETGDTAPGEYGTIDWKQFSGETLTVLCTAMPVSEVYEDLIAEFEELTGIKVEWEMLNDTDRKNAQLVDFNAGSGKYDVSNVGISNREEFVAGGYLEALEPYLSNADLTDADWYNVGDYPDPVLAGGKSNADQTLVMIPYTAEYFLLWYREDIFDQLGLEVPKTITELETTAQAIEDARAAGDVDTYAFVERTMSGSGEGGWDMFCTANRISVDLMDFANNKALINTEGGIELMEYYTRMCMNFGPEGSENWTWTDINDAFSQGLLAMICGGNAGAPGAANPDNSQVADKVNFAAVPMNEGGKDPLWEWGWAINSDSHNKDASWLLVQWLTSPTLMKKMGPLYGCPARESIYSDADYISAMPSQEFIDAQLYMMTEGINPSPSLLDAHYAEAADIISREMNNVVAGIKDAETACADAETALVELGYSPAS